MKARQALLPEVGGKFEILESEVPSPKTGELVVRQELCGVCATDAHMWQGRLPGVAYPIVLGHEPIGVIEALGPGIDTDSGGRKVAVGDRVYVAPGIYCGRCYFCFRLREPTLCEFATGIGFNPDPDRPELRGGWSEYMLLDHPRQTFLKFEGVDAQTGVFLEPLCVGIHAFERISVRAGDVVVIQGAGAVGMGALIAAQESGAFRTIVIGAPSTRLELARSLGADVTIDIEDEPDPQRRADLVRAETTHGFGADVVVECTGSPGSVREGIELLRRGGTYVVAGHFTDRGSVELNPFTHMNNNQVSIHGVWGNDIAHFIQALPILESARYATADIVSHRVGLERVEDVCLAMTGDYRLDGEQIRKVAIEAAL